MPMPLHAITARCACGKVELQGKGTPLASVACYCDDCQAGSRQLEALTGAGKVSDADGGTAYVLFRTDRVERSRGADLLQAHKLKPKSATSRVVASCCNSPMFIGFDDMRHWVPVYRARFAADAPPLEMRVCTKFKPADAVIPDDVPSHAMYPAKFMFRLLGSKIAMLLGR